MRSATWADGRDGWEISEGGEARGSGCPMHAAPRVGEGREHVACLCTVQYRNVSE